MIKLKSTLHANILIQKHCASCRAYGKGRKMNHRICLPNKVLV